MWFIGLREVHFCAKLYGAACSTSKDIRTGNASLKVTFTDRAETSNKHCPSTIVHKTIFVRQFGLRVSKLLGVKH